jgi:hypothetical protein
MRSRAVEKLPASLEFTRRSQLPPPGLPTFGTHTVLAKALKQWKKK